MPCIVSQAAVSMSGARLQAQILDAEDTTAASARLPPWQRDQLQILLSREAVPTSATSRARKEAVCAVVLLVALGSGNGLLRQD